MPAVTERAWRSVVEELVYQAVLDLANATDDRNAQRAADALDRLRLVAYGRNDAQARELVRRVLAMHGLPMSVLEIGIEAGP